ncbi:MAG: hypothetical protein K0R84_2763 [Clostridia bacterium]|nr:hypothetical protein [Clostridia bacterium]
MKSVKITIIILLILSLSAALWFGIYTFAKPVLSGAFSTQLTTAQKLEDFDYLYKTLEENYPFFEVKKRMLGYDWLEQKDQFEENIRNTKNDREFYEEINKIVNLVQNAHTHVLSGSFYDELKSIYEDPHGGYSPARRDILNNEKAIEKVKYWDTKFREYDNYIPIIFRYVQGEYIVLDGNVEDYDIPRGSTLTAVDGVEIKDYIKSLSDKTYLYYDYLRKQQKLDELIILTEPGQRVQLTLRTPDYEAMKLIQISISLNLKMILHTYGLNQCGAAMSLIPNQMEKLFMIF